MISAIVAIDENYGIGYKGDLLCSIKEDLKHFKELTTNNIVVMGRKTWDSLPKKPLPNRVNIVITNSVTNLSLKDNVIYVRLDLFKRIIKELGEKSNIYIMGGSHIYKELLPYCEYVHLTKIHKSFENVDTYFPVLKDDEWELLDAEPIMNQEDIEYQFEIYKRKG